MVTSILYLYELESNIYIKHGYIKNLQWVRGMIFFSLFLTICVKIIQ